MIVLLGKVFVRVLLALAVIGLGIACRQDAPPTEGDAFTLQSPGNNGGTGASDVDPAKVIDHLKANELPIGRVDVYSAENDPSQRLGRPGQYIGKAIFQDSRKPLALFEGQDVMSFQDSGGVVETFSSVDDLESRKEFLESARKQFPTAPPEYQYTKGAILLRLGHVLTPEEAAQYERALQSFQG